MRLDQLKPREGAKSSNAYRTMCKRCRRGIYVGQPAVWSTDPVGLVHEGACL